MVLALASEMERAVLRREKARTDGAAAAAAAAARDADVEVERRTIGSAERRRTAWRAIGRCGLEVKVRTHEKLLNNKRERGGKRARRARST